MSHDRPTRREEEDPDAGLEGIRMWECSSASNEGTQIFLLSIEVILLTISLMEGVDTLFLHITRQLILQGDKLERERLRKERESVVLEAPSSLDNMQSVSGKKNKSRGINSCCT